MKKTVAAPEWTCEEYRIRSVIDRYFHALDLLDGSVLEQVFSKDIEARYHVGTPGEFMQRGRDAVVSYLMDNMGAYLVRTHVGANTHAWPDGNDARAITMAIALISRGGKNAAMRGLRYEDRLVRCGSQWQISERRHTAIWQYDTDLAPVHVPALALQMARSQRADPTAGGT